MRKIIYIINPVSGKGPKQKIRELIEEKTKKKNLSFQVFPSVASGDYSFLSSIIKDEKITDVVIAGGDGTISQVVGSLLTANISFGIIPCGSGNGLALTAKIPLKPEKALEIIFRGNTALVDGFTVNGKFACMLSGLGFDAKVAHDFALQPKRGFATYVKEVVRNFFLAKTWLFEIEVNNMRIETEAYFLSIANSNQFGNHFTIAPKASLSDGKLDIVIVTHQNKLLMLLQTLRQVSGRNKLQTDSVIDKDRAVIYFQAEALKIKNKSDAPFHLDGDPAETPAELDIEVKKKCFKLIQP